MKVAILGGGAAGIISALELNQKSRIETILFDSNPLPGRKLAVTGSGRGNLTNLVQEESCYRSMSESHLLSGFRYPDPEMIRRRLREYGIPTVATDDGWVYPASNSAANVASILRAQLQARQVEIVSETKITRLSVDPDGAFQISSSDGRRFGPFSALLVASGSRAYPQLGADDSILPEIRALGIAAHDFVPALTGIVFEKADKRLSGNRLDVRAALYADRKRLAYEIGNLIFTDFGVNGPAAMNLSHLVHEPIAANKKTELSIDLLSNHSSDYLREIFHDPAFRRMPYLAIFNAVLPEKICIRFFDRWRVPLDVPAERVEPSAFKAHLKSLSDLRFLIAGTKSFRDAQVGFGGVDLNEIDPLTMRSKKIPGLYFAGEILDCIGRCGGYNLSWAFLTGMRAGRAIADLMIPN